MTAKSKSKKTSVRELRLLQLALNKTKQNKKKKHRATTNPIVGRIAAMIATPCGKFLEGGQYGDIQGSCNRLRSSFSIGSTNQTGSGYVLWCPDYSPEDNYYTKNGETLLHANCFAWISSDSSATPINSSTVHFGSTNRSVITSGTATLTTATMADPCSNLNEEGLVQDMRCLSACIRFTAPGKALDVSGEYAMINNIGLESLVPSVGGFTPVTVDDLFDYATHTDTIQKRTVEVRYRPSVDSAVFRSSRDGAAHVYAVPGTNVTVPSESAKTQTPRFFGIAWRNVDTTVGHPFSVQLVKNIEYRTRPLLHMSQTPVRTISEIPLVKPALEVLDKLHPDWAEENDESWTDIVAKVALGAAGQSVKHLAGSIPGLLSDVFGGSGVPMHAIAGLAGPAPIPSVEQRSETGGGTVPPPTPSGPNGGATADDPGSPPGRWVTL